MDTTLMSWVTEERQVNRIPDGNYVQEYDESSMIESRSSYYEWVQTSLMSMMRMGKISWNLPMQDGNSWDLQEMDKGLGYVRYKDPIRK